ncbi:LysE family translocator [Microbulbifer okhotskensis]|uniref:LysE family translocator n=1 Tax=Microbulbifer okhotskensis TaxID=2926617 RepID=UPI00359C486D
MITLLNPKPIVFFMALFPQFITAHSSYQSQFIILSATFSLLVVIIHCIYAALCQTIKSKTSNPKRGRIINRLSAGLYMLLGTGLTISNKVA